MESSEPKYVTEARHLAITAYAAFSDIARLIENSASREEAGAIEKEVNTFFNEGAPFYTDDIWEYWVDWEKVKWSKEEAIKEAIRKKILAAKRTTS